MQNAGCCSVGGKTMSEGNTLLKIDNLKMWFPLSKGVLFKRNHGYIRAVDGISFSIMEGETLGLVGESGCGKTTTGRCILQLEKPTSGSILFKGKEVSDYCKENPMDFRRQVQVIFQDPYGSLNPRMTVEKIIADPMVVHKIHNTKEAVHKRVLELMKLVGLKPEMGSRFPHQFSGGERQRIGIARALALNPSFIICDEAVSALDVSIQAQIVNLFSELQKKLKLTYLFISHDLAVVRHISNRIAVMYLGHIVEIADSNEIYDSPLHPYTRALLSAVTIPDPEIEMNRKPILLQGELPSLAEERKGCVFASRCPMRGKECTEKEPEFVEYGSGHYVACFKIDKRRSSNGWT